MDLEKHMQIKANKKSSETDRTRRRILDIHLFHPFRIPSSSHETQGGVFTFNLSIIFSFIWFIIITNIYLLSL